MEERWRQFTFHKAGAGIVIYFLDGDRWAGGGAVGGVTVSVVSRYQGQIASENITLNTVSRWLVLIVWVCLID